MGGAPRPAIVGAGGRSAPRCGASGCPYNSNVGSPVSSTSGRSLGHERRRKSYE